MRLRRLLIISALVSACQSPVPSATTSVTSAPTANPSVAPATPKPATPEPSEGVVGRYADGLPRSIDGQPVVRGDTALALARATTDATPFLVGGWTTFLNGTRYGCFPLGDDSWRSDCVRVRFSDVAGSLDRALTDAITFRYVFDVLADEPPTISGPIVVQAHVHDPRAGECGESKGVCDGMMVVDQIVWQGDEATAPAPITQDDIVAAIEVLQAGSDVAPYGASSVFTDCGNTLPTSLILMVTDAPRRTPAVNHVDLLATAEALARALDRPEGAEAALRPKAVVCESRAWDHGVLTEHVTGRWLVVANAALMVMTAAEPTAADRTFLRKLEDILTP